MKNYNGLNRETKRREAKCTQYDKNEKHLFAFSNRSSGCVRLKTRPIAYTMKTAPFLLFFYR